MRQLGASTFIKAQAHATDPRAPADPSDRVESALEFLRTWASFNFPRALTALERIQAEVFGRLGLPVGYYAPFAVRVENLMLPPALAALDEYGLPLQLVGRLEPVLPATSDLDTVISALRRLEPARLGLSRFEMDLIKGDKRNPMTIRLDKVESSRMRPRGFRQYRR